jgi:hypothetical protein
MLAFALVILACGAGCIVTYFIMEAPRKQAKEQLARLRGDRLRLEEQRNELEGQADRLNTRNQALASAVGEHDRRAKELAVQLAEFDKRVISYDELAIENSILKTDLKNLTIQMAHQDCLLDTSRQELTAVMKHRDQLGRQYFDELRSLTRKGITTSNYPANKQRLRTTVERVRMAGVELSQADEEQALAELHAQYERAVRVATEREEQSRLREQIREEQRREREAQEAVEQAEREKRAIEDALQRALADAAGRHATEVDRLRTQLAEAEAKSRRAISLAEITKTGHVYVISNRGSFGSDVFKIGMTRRLDPMDRVHELGDASVPFPFDVHMTITCDDAPKLEAALHRAFHKQRVNKVNLRKEFFRVTITEIVEAVRDLHGEVVYQADAEALEYMQSQTMTDEDLAEVENAYSQVAKETITTTDANDDQDD